MHATVKKNAFHQPGSGVLKNFTSQARSKSRLCRQFNANLYKRASGAIWNIFRHRKAFCEPLLSKTIFQSFCLSYLQEKHASLYPSENCSKLIGPILTVSHLSFLVFFESQKGTSSLAPVAAHWDLAVFGVGSWVKVGSDPTVKTNGEKLNLPFPYSVSLYILESK